MNKMRARKLIYIFAILTGNLAAAASGQDAASLSFSQSPSHFEEYCLRDLFDFDDPYNDEVYGYREQDFFGGLMRQEESNDRVSGDNIYGSESENLDASTDRGPEICFVENLFGTEGLPTSIPVMDAFRALESTSRDDEQATQEFIVSTRREKRGRGGEERFKCTHEGCSQVLVNRSALDIHMRTHTGERPHPCTHEGCSYAAKFKSFLDIHMRTHTGERPYQCTYEGCSYASNNVSNLSRHMRRKHTEERPYACTQDGCLYAAKTKQELKVHMRRHNKEGVQKRSLSARENGMPTSMPIIAALQTQIGIRSNSSEMTLGESVDNNQPTEEGVPRSLVGDDEIYDFNFGEISDFLRDTTGFSLEENQGDVFDTEAQNVACTDSSSSSSWSNSEYDVSCTDKTSESENYSFDENEEVSVVQRLENDNEGITRGEPTVNIQREERGREGEKRFKCTHDGCPYAAKQKADLSKHVRRKHTDERPYACNYEGCSYAAADASSLKDHMRTHANERPYACTQEGCSHAAKSKSSLKLHMGTHTGERPYACTHEGCSYAAKFKSVLDIHMRTHTGERTYSCTQEGCSYAAKFKSTLNDHMLTHTEERPYACTYEGCSYAAKFNSDLKRHISKHTGEKPYKCTYEGCLYAAARASNLSRHMQKHTKEKFPKKQCIRTPSNEEHEDNDLHEVE